MDTTRREQGRNKVGGDFLKKSRGIELVEKRIVIPSDFLKKDYRYNIYFDLDRVKENKIKKPYQYPFCSYSIH
jgi:hypothetical protein